MNVTYSFHTNEQSTTIKISDVGYHINIIGKTSLQFAHTYKYYKMRRLDLFTKAAHVITQCAHYYKMPQLLLQNVAEQTLISSILLLCRLKHDLSTIGEERVKENLIAY